MEGLAFAAKDALLIVDDYAPRGAASDRQRLERDADRLLRAQGNRSGRQRMRADGSLPPPRPPRGLILSTGEDVPPGQSLRGRMLILEVSPGDVPLVRLTPHQQAATAGNLAAALAGFVHWLAPRYGELCGQLPGEWAGLRDRAQTGMGSARTPGIVADLALALKCFLDFALAVEAITAPERDDLARRGRRALQTAAAAQREHVEVAEPCGQFLRLLAGVLASGRGHIAGPRGDAPEDPERWGWREATVGAGEHVRQEWRPQGHRVGWVDGFDVYLEPDAAYAAANNLAREQSDGLAISARTLRKRLHERGLLASTDTEREVLTVRKTLEGKRREVMHLRAASLYAEKPDQPDQTRAEPEENGRDCGRVPSCPTQNPTTKPDQFPAETDELVGLVGSDTGIDGPSANESPFVVEATAPSPNGSAGPHFKPRWRGTL